ncbi:MAG TPA: hypothetical protein VKY31_00825 [Terriglobia bacterium]|nr:hypothetical protein [Terriglobia bacterium]
MKHRFLISFFCFVALTGIAAAQAPKKATLSRTADGHPDIQGIWSFATITPLQRPAELAGKEFFTAKEAEEYEKETRERNDKDRRDGSAEADVGRAYNDFWWDPGTKVVKTLRTSLVIDPKDGHIPPLTPAGRERQNELRNANRGHEYDGPENRPLPERCLKLQGAGPPITPTAYNNHTQIVQGPGYVALWVEMGHEVRIIPTDSRPHLPENIQLWNGDSRGHWDGDTLVIETTNFNDKAPFQNVATKNMKLTERFTPIDATTLRYQFTVDDPATWTRPWTVEIPIVKTGEQIYEYACHEGNYGMMGALAGARAEEKEQKK